MSKEIIKEQQGYHKIFDFCPHMGPLDRRCQRARKGHFRSLKRTNKQKNFVDKLSFLNRFAQHALKPLARTSLRVVSDLYVINISL